MITLEYSSNNSGGYWWLEDEHWYKLEAAGWEVEWKKNETGFSRGDSNGRWLGALATRASKKVDSVEEGVNEWKEITGQDPAAIGCTCCGEPHNFSYTDENGNFHYSSYKVLDTVLDWS